MNNLQRWKDTKSTRKKKTAEEIKAEDDSADSLSYIGKAAYDELRTKHPRYHQKLWNVSDKSRLVGDMWYSPQDAFDRTESIDPPEGHDDWLPRKMGSIIAKTEEWCDVMSLAPPDGLFLKCFQDALAEICNRNAGGLAQKHVVVRMMFGNIIGMPVDCHEVMSELTRNLPANANERLKLWVGSWRKGVSWNHAKIIAVDGKHLWTGGHNLYDMHYLRYDPINDISHEFEGPVAHDGHLFANKEWAYIVRKKSSPWGHFVEKCVPDAWDVPRRARVTVSNFPIKPGAAEMPPKYIKRSQLRREGMREGEPNIPLLSMGRYGVLLKKARPSDDAIIAIFDAAQKSIRIAAQDFGPPLLPGTKMALPKTTWPYPYLDALARAIWKRGVDVHLVLSNPRSVPRGCSSVEAPYGYGWNCVDVAAEIIKCIKQQFPDSHDGDLRRRVQNNLRLCFLRSPTGGTQYADGRTLGLHAKHYIIDDIFCYTGSQNLYDSDLAEWGVCIDHAETVQRIKSQYWDRMWLTSFRKEDCNVDHVMDGLKIDRSAPSKAFMAKMRFREAKEHAKDRVKSKARELSSRSFEIQSKSSSSRGEDSSTSSGPVSEEDGDKKDITKPIKDENPSKSDIWMQA